MSSMTLPRNFIIPIKMLEHWRKICFFCFCVRVKTSHHFQKMFDWFLYDWLCSELNVQIIIKVQMGDKNDQTYIKTLAV